VLTVASVSEDSMLTVVEVAEKLGIKPSTVRLWIVRGTLGHVRLNRLVRIRLSEVNRVIAEGTVPARTGAGRPRVDTAPVAAEARS
jgi:excisionase family DNA binding protein